MLPNYPQGPFGVETSDAYPVQPAQTVSGPDIFGASSLVGASLDYARADHHHGLPAGSGAFTFGAVGDIVAEAIASAASAGATGKVADAAHRHAMPTAATLAASAANGSTVRFAAGVPAGAPAGTELPIAFDSTAVTGGVYYWTGAAWVKGGTI